jgi:malate dehydrogenase
MGWIGRNRVEAIVERTRNGGLEIVTLMKTSSAFYAPASAALAMAESYLQNQKRVFSCAVYLNGEYGVTDRYVGVPVVIGAGGVERIIELDLDASEKLAFDKSVAAVEGLISTSLALNPSLASRP